MYGTAVLQGKTIEAFHPSPPLPPPHPTQSHHPLRLIDVADGEAGIPGLLWASPFFFFLPSKEELGGGQEVTLGKVTDERAVEGGREVALKRRGRGWWGGKLGKIDHRG